jgi:hypothetical protein
MFTGIIEEIEHFKGIHTNNDTRRLEISTPTIRDSLRIGETSHYVGRSARRSAGDTCMRFHHMAIFVSDMDAAVRLWRDVLGFPVMIDKSISDEQGVYLAAEFHPEPPSDIAEPKMARSRIVVLSSSEGAAIELQQRKTPKLWKMHQSNPHYRRTGMP